MKKMVLKPATMISTIPSGMVSYGNHPGGYISITRTWTGRIKLYR